jgi:hypothetical protein
VLSQRDGGLGLIYGSEVRPTLYVFHMYRQFGNQLAYASSGVADVTVYAAKRADGILTLMVINLSDSEQHVPLQVQGQTPITADVWLLDATHQAEDLGPQPIPADGLLSLPAQSVSLYVLSK